MPVVDDRGSVRGALRVSLLPTASPGTWSPLVDATTDSGSGDGAPTQVLEDWEYLYEFQDLPQGTITTDHDDVLFPDSSAGVRGRLRPGSRVGTLPVTVSVRDRIIGHFSIEVRSRKLGYLTEYRWMLRDLAAVSATLVMERFAPTQQRFVPAELLDARTAYQRFAFLQGLLADPAFQSSAAEVLGRPHHDWEGEPEWRAPARGLPPKSSAARALLLPGPRTPWNDSFIPRLASLPAKVQVPVDAETLDTVPNRFVKFALTRWFDVIQSLGVAVKRGLTGAASQRAVREIEAVASWLESMLGLPMFKEVGPLLDFPSNNIVLQRRSGYRDVFRAYVLFETAAQLSWVGGDEVYSAGQRDAATLYEYWCFLQLAGVVKGLCASFNERSLVRDNAGELGLGLQRGSETVVDGVLERLGRPLRLELSFNRTFGFGPGGSWTRPMRPDCSLRLSPLEPGAAYESTWLHFDAKYRVDQLVQIFGSDEAAGDVIATEGTAKRDDLLKMHAYRDAIKRTSGSYVLYPGSPAGPPMRSYHEVLPGLGAFSLKPSAGGDVLGARDLQIFLDEVLTHFASVLTQHRRYRYWESVAFMPMSQTDQASGWAPEIGTPAADTRVLLGFVKSADHLSWIQRQKRYNLRLGDRTGAVGIRGEEVSARILVLHGPALSQPLMYFVQDGPEMWAKEEMVASGYPQPRGSSYLCVVLGQPFVAAADQVPTRQRVSKLARPDGSPTLVSWLELAK